MTGHLFREGRVHRHGGVEEHHVPRDFKLPEIAAGLESVQGGDQWLA